MFTFIISKKDYTTTEGKRYLSVMIGDQTSVMVDEELFNRINTGDKVMITSNKLKTKAGSFFTLRTLIPMSDLA